MNSISPSGSRSPAAAHASTATYDSEKYAGVRFTVGRMSFARRIELVKRIREIGRQAEYLDAGGDTREKLEAAVLAAEIDRMYLEWGLIAIEGLSIDGEAATAEAVIERGPMDLAAEILAKIKAECWLTDDERKN